MVKKNRKRYVAYYRVSTKKQSGEMSAQKTAVKNYLKDKWPPEKNFIETEAKSGKTDKNRPALQEALNYCRKHKAVLVVAKLDRLSRDLEFIGWIQKEPVEFVCCDMPQATRETIGFMGVMARWEREQIAKRTKEALAEKRKEGVKLGFNNPKVRAGLKKHWKKLEIKKAEKKKLASQNILKIKAGPAKKSARQIADAKVLPIFKSLRQAGLSWKKIADNLNNTGIKTRVSGKWHQTSVLAVARRNNLV